jgi:hypothetical protein
VTSSLFWSVSLTVLPHCPHTSVTTRKMLSAASSHATAPPPTPKSESPVRAHPCTREGRVLSYWYLSISASDQTVSPCISSSAQHIHFATVGAR